MNDIHLYKLRFPIGEFNFPSGLNKDELSSFNDTWINSIKEFPKTVKSLTSELTIEKNWKYRPNGWMLKQVVHHCADSHINAFIRIKKALTENQPVISGYEEAKWAELTDSLEDDLAGSITILLGLHLRWARLLTTLNEQSLQLTYYHPESKTLVSVQEAIATYAWHCDHHLAHIQLAINSEGKYN